MVSIVVPLIGELMFVEILETSRIALKKQHFMTDIWFWVARLKELEIGKKLKVFTIQL
jgi:hypothetical protein